MNPIASPKRMPSGTEFTLRAKIPAATPAINPLIVDPTMIPTIMVRTAGVNHAVPPSIAPKTAPSSNPSSTLFIVSLLGDLRILVQFLTTNSGIPLGSSAEKNQNQHAHH